MDTRTVERALGAPHRGFLHALAAALLVLVAAAMAAWALPASAADDGAFPLTITDDEGTQVTIEALPQRIVSLSPANTEIVFALGAGDRLVGRTDWDDYPPEAAALTPVATFSGVVMEQLVALEPDLVLAAGNFFTPPDDVATMRDLGIPVVVVYAPDVPTVMADIELIGAAVGAGDQSRAVTAKMTAQLDAISAAVAELEAPRTYYELDYFEGVSYAPAPASFVADMVALAGGDPITTGDAAVFEMPVERLVEADPQVIVLGDAMFGHCPEAVADRVGWADMTAVAKGDVRPVDGELVTRPGPRLAQGLASLVRAIHPEVALAGFPADPPMCEAA